MGRNYRFRLFQKRRGVRGQTWRGSGLRVKMENQNLEDTNGGTHKMQYIASISYGKDSLAMLEVIKQHDMPLDRIVHVEIMATDTIPADLHDGV